MTLFVDYCEGDDVRLASRLIVAPVAGVFRPRPQEDVITDTAPSGDGIVNCGDVIGVVDGPGRQVDVASCFTGLYRGLLAEAGERVRPGQPLAWLEDAPDAVRSGR